MNKNIVWLLVGLVLFALGMHQNIQYEDNSLRVYATITDINTEDHSDDGPASYLHTYYGEYTVDGKRYANMKLDSKFSSSWEPQYSRGDTIEIQVTPNKPEKQMANGDLFGVAGFALIVYNLSVLIKSRKKETTE